MHKSNAFEMDNGLARMDLPDLRINYDPVDPDQFDRPIISFCIETGLRALAETFSLPYSSADTISDLSSAVSLFFEHRDPVVLEVSISGL
jgi:hypothetical protein